MGKDMTDKLKQSIEICVLYSIFCKECYDSDSELKYHQYWCYFRKKYPYGTSDYASDGMDELGSIHEMVEYAIECEKKRK